MNASVVVAIAAIVVATVFNVLSLRRSSKTLESAAQTYTRTEQRYQADRQEARNDRLRDALIDVAAAVTVFNRENAWYVKLLADVAVGHITAGSAQHQDVERLRPAVSEAYRAIQVVLFLSSNDEIRTIVKDILKATNLVASHELSPAGISQARAFAVRQIS